MRWFRDGEEACTFEVSLTGRGRVAVTGKGRMGKEIVMRIG